MTHEGPSLPTSIAEVLTEPPRAFSPTAIWWWSGERLDRARLRDQLQRFARGGVFNLVLLNLAPSGPLFGSDADDPPFLSDDWWALLEGVCDDARALGIGLWFYDQLGFSGADLQARLVDERPGYAGRRLERVHALVDGPGELCCPDGGQPLAGSAEPVDGDGSPVGPAIPLPLVAGAGTASVRAPGPGRVSVRAPGPGRWRLTLHHHTALGFDYLGADACAALLAGVHGEFERRLGDRLGTVVVGSFQDELPALPTWSAGFADAFRRLRGYDLVPHLDALYEDGAHRPEVHRIRHDYHLTRAELAEAAFFRPLAAWHERHGLVVGCDQQDPARAGHPVAGVELYADYARTHRWFSAPGSDHHGDARIHSSLAHLYGRPRTWIEAFHSTGWGGTLEETYDWLLPWLRAGATLYNPHAVYYTTKGGWWEWAPPGTDWRQPYWTHHRVFADAVTRLCAILSLGSHLCDTAILLPTTTAQTGAALDGVSADARRAQAVYLDLVGDMTWFRTRPGVTDRLGLDADVIDDDSLARALVRDSGDGTRLCVAGESYATLVLPACTALEEDTALRLVEFASAGGELIAIGALPEEVIGRDGAAGPDKVRDELRACFADGRAVLVGTADGLGEALGRVRARTGTQPVVRASVPALARRVADATVVFLTAASFDVPRATRAAVAAPDERGAAQGWLDARYDFDPDRYVRHAHVRVRDVEGPAVLLDPFGGEPRTVPVRRAEDDDRAVEAEVPFDRGPAAVLVFPGRAAERTGCADGPVVADPARTTIEVPPDAEWDMTLVPTLDNSWGDFARPGPYGSPERPAGGDDREGCAVVECRTVRRGRAGDPARPRAHATFGPHALLLDGDGGSAGGSPLEWSDTLGVHKDPIHRDVLGPKGHVPEEFVRIGPIAAGTVARVRTELLLDEAFDGHLAVGAAARKTVRLGGVPVALDDGGHLALGPVRLAPGGHLLELDLTPEQDVDLRAHVALVRDPERYRRPEWILAPGGRASVATTLTVVDLPARAIVQIASRGRCVLRVNGQVVGIQGGFDPYAEHSVPRVRRHDIASALRIGVNELAVGTDDGEDPAVLVDAALYDVDGRCVTTVHSDGTWRAERAGEPVPVVVRREQVGDPAALYLRRRPHPLPGAAWLDPDADDGTVVPVGFAVPGARPGVEWFRCELPPGTRRLTVDIEGATTVFVDGHERTATTTADSGSGSGSGNGSGSGSGRGGGVTGPHTVTVDLTADGPSGTRTVALRVETRPGHQGGAALAGPVRCEVGPGRIRTGDWESRGLAEYSGGVRYSRVLTLPADAGTGRVTLDLGRVRGTAEVRVDGVAAGVRVCSPYVFDVTGLAGPGDRTVEITVFGTLAPYLDAVSPTHFVFPGQRVTGLMGPVRLITGPLS
ncbi:glycosyl hydrolase [Streptomyces sp. NPDC094034]|uniref:glycosyl hydrolase n=1 Tax=Streptomyces sp. NPDC094034 TaxID=3155309 RepID=UPI003317821A